MLEESLIKRCIEGNRMAQEKLYTFYAAKMRGICARYAKSIFEAEDIFQEAFVKVFLQLGNFKMQGSLDGWIKRIIVNTAIDHYKLSLKKNNHVHLEVLEEYEVTSVPLADDLEEEDLLRMLNKLPDGYKLIFNLYAIEGYSHKEIADMLDIAEGTSKSQLSKARKHLQVLLHLSSIEENGTRTI